MKEHNGMKKEGMKKGMRHNHYYFDGEDTVAVSEAPAVSASAESEESSDGPGKKH